MAVPLLDLKAQHASLAEELRETFARVLESGRFVLGGEVERFEAAMAEWLGVPATLGVSSGTDALIVALMAAGVGPGDEVIVPSFTFFATAGSVSRVGATPVFADVCPHCFTLNPEEVARMVTPRTKALIPVHLFGQTAPLEALFRIAQENGLIVIEDAAQSLGARYGDQPNGTLGDFGAYSFFPTKNLGALGDGGLLVARDPAMQERIRFLRNHGDTSRYRHDYVGGNFRLDALQAALLEVKCPHLDGWIEKRQAVAARYRALLQELPGVVTGCPGDCACQCQPQTGPEGRLVLPATALHGTHTWNQFTLRLPFPGERDALRNWLNERQIGNQVYYPVALNEQPCFAPLGQAGSTPVAQRLTGEVLSLPMFPELTPAQQDEVVEAIRDWLQA